MTPLLEEYYGIGTACVRGGPALILVCLYIAENLNSLEN